MLAFSTAAPSSSPISTARCSGQVPLVAPANGVAIQPPNGVTGQPTNGAASQPVTAVTSATVEMTPDQARQSVQWLADQLLRHMPSKFDGDDDWGNTKSVWAGVKVRRDGWKISTKRRRKELRHGRWVRYDIQLPQLERSTQSPTGGVPIIPRAVLPPEASPLLVRSVVPTQTAAGQPGWLVDAVVRTPAKFHIRIERWNLGVQAFSISVDGTMEVNLDCKFVMGLSADYREVIPAIQLNVQVQEARVNMNRFNVERISKLGGDAAEELGNLAEDTLIRLWLKKENARLADRLNQEIEEHQSDLRWSMMQWLGQWNAADASTESFLR
nr:hypothetical protein [Rhodopirellula sp. JC740]